MAIMHGYISQLISYNHNALTQFCKTYRIFCNSNKYFHYSKNSKINICKCFVMFCGLCHIRLPTFILSYQRPLRLCFLSSTSAHFLSHMLKYGGTMFILYKKCGWTYCLSGLATKLLDWHKLQRLTDIKEVCTECEYSSHSSIPLQRYTCFI